MTLAIRLVLGVSALAFAVGSAACSSSPSSPTIVPAGGNANASTGTGGTGTAAGGTGTTTGGTGVSAGGAGNAAGGSSVAGVPLTPTMGWVDGASNTLGIQGAFFTYADPTTLTSVMSDTMSSSKICISGTAAKVIMPCTIVPPATDCYGTYWGAAIGFNLNQPNDPTTMMGGTPVPFNASAIKGFAFDVGPGADGTATIPLPSQFRFNIEDATTQYCSPAAKGVKMGSNSYSFTDVEAQCYAPMPGPTATTIQTGVVKISWQVVTNTQSTVPFDFCISNVVALQ
jgi:hypothetical protein